VPRLVEILRRQRAGASFLFSLGPDHTGRAIKRVFRPGFMKKVQRTSVVSHYGIKTLMYGTLLPGPDIGRRGADIMRATPRRRLRNRDPLLGSRQVAGRCGHCHMAWTEIEMRRAHQRYVEIFGNEAPGHGAAGWQMNPTPAPDAAPRLSLGLGLPRHAPLHSRCGMPKSSPARNCRPRCRPWTNWSAPTT
jgi:undecaprenyl phosphate-alpha-L-ara4FN deformylase